MREKLEEIKKNALDVLQKATDIDALEEARIKFLGKKGELTAVLKGMGQLSKEERPQIGALANEIRGVIENHIDTKKAEISEKLEEIKLKSEVIDVTMPGKAQKTGKLHPLTKVMNNIKDTFIGMGFEIAEGPEVELDYYNFEALNIPPNHPARDTQDTFYINENTVLRTQTSPIQVRVMEKKKPPIRIIAPGRVYRSDAVDATHSPVFHQIEGLVVDKGVTMADLKGTLEMFIHRLYGENTKVRFRPHHFPFTDKTGLQSAGAVLPRGAVRIPSAGRRFPATGQRIANATAATTRLLPPNIGSPNRGRKHTKTAQNVGELHLFSSRCDANTSHSTAPTPKAMRSNRTGRTTDNRLFRWNGRFFVTFSRVALTE